MNCIEFASNLDLYVDGELPREEAEAFNQHIVACPYCQDKCRAEELFKAAVRSLPKRTCTDCVKDDVRHMVLNSELV